MHVDIEITPILSWAAADMPIEYVNINIYYVWEYVFPYTYEYVDKYIHICP